MGINMKAEELVRELHKVSADIRYLVKICSALEMKELEIAIARTADTLSATVDTENCVRYTNLGRLLVLYRRNRAAGFVKCRTMKRVSLWQSSGDQSLVDYAIEVMYSIPFQNEGMKLLSNEEVVAIIHANGK
jgi:hypothetical protein